RDVAAGLRHVRRAGHARGTRADDADAERLRIDEGDVGPAFPDGLVAHEALEASDGDGLQRIAHRAHASALVLLRAHASADVRQQVGVGQDVVGPTVILLAELLDEAGDVDAHRAAGNAGLVGAEQAALGFAQRLFHAVAAGHFLEVLRPRRGVLLAHGRALLR